MEYLTYVFDHVADVLAFAGALAVAAGIVARLTPNKTDDALVAKVEAFLARAATLFTKPKAKPVA